MPNKSQIISAVRWLALGRFAGQAVSWLVTILVMRILSPQDYGLAAMGATLIALIALISESGFGTAVVQAKDITREQCASVFGAAVLFGLASFALVAALSPLLGSFYRDQRVTGIVQLAGLTFVLASLSTIPDAMLRRTMNFKKLSAIDFASTLIGSVATYVLALSAFEYWALVLGPLTYSTCRTVLLHLLVKDRILPSFRIAPALQLIKFGGQVAAARLAGYAVTHSDIIFAGRILGKEALGIYTVALDLALMPVNKIMSVVNQVALPALSTIGRERPEAQGESLLAGLRLVAYVLFPCLVGMAAIAPSLVEILLGEKWRAVVVPLQIIALATCLRVITIFVSTASIGFGRVDIELKDRLTSACIFPVCYLLGAAYGVVGLAASWLLAIPLALLINLGRTRIAFGVGRRQVLRALIRPALFSTLMGAASLGIGVALQGALHLAIALAVNILASAALYMILVWYLDRSQAQVLLNVFRFR